MKDSRSYILAFLGGVLIISACKRQEFDPKIPLWTAEVQFAGEGTIICADAPSMPTFQAPKIGEGTIIFYADGTGENRELEQVEQPSFHWIIDEDTLLLSAGEDQGIYIYTYYVLDPAKTGYDTKHYKATHLKGKEEGDVPCIIDFSQSESHLILKK